MAVFNKRAVVAGHICLDITPVFPQSGGNTLSNILTPGKLIYTKGVNVSTGGAVANTGLGMKILGADVSLMGKVGKDAFGDIVIGILKKYGAEGGMIVSNEEKTSYSVVIAPPGVDRIFLHDPGANDSFKASDIDFEKIREADIFHFGYPTIMRSMYVDNGYELAEMMKKVKDMGVITSLDMAGLDPSSEAGSMDWTVILKRVMPYVDLFLPSFEELCFMVNKEKYQSLIAEGKDMTELISVERDVVPLGDKLMEWGAKTLIIKCGAPGMYYRTTDAAYMKSIENKLGIRLEEWSSKEGFERSYVPDRVLSGTGAGDTSIAAFLTAAMRGYSLERCLQAATGAGALCVTEYDALGGLKTIDEIFNRIDGGWEKQSLIKFNH